LTPRAVVDGIRSGGLVFSHCRFSRENSFFHGSERK
jgi:hypothetical protein